VPAIEVIRVSGSFLMAYERIQVVGNIGSAETRKSGAGNPYFEMSVATDRGIGGAKQTVWYKVLLFGAMAQKPEALANYTKGRQVLVEGRPQVEAYLKKDGTPGLDNAIVAISMPELLGHK
jgi:single-stranded DNA-binding protein